MNVMHRPGYGDPPTLDAIPRGHFAETRNGEWNVVDSKVRSGQQRIDDSLQSFVSGLGTWKDPTTQLKFCLKPLNRDEVENAFRGDWIARRIVMAPAEDATREWRSWQANQDQIETIEAEERTHNIQKKTREAIFKARLYGGAGMVIGVDDGKDVIEPLDLDSVKAGDLKFVVVMNRYELAAGPRIYNVNSPWYTYPEYFTVQTPMFGFYGEHGDTYPNSYASGEWVEPPGRVGKDPTGRGDPARQMTPISGMVRIHPSRVVQFVGNELPDWRLVPLGGLWGDSVLQTIDDILKDFGLTIGSVANMVNDAKMDVIKIPNLTSLHLATQEATSALLSRFGLANQAKSTVNSLLLDSGEEWERIQSTFSGLPDVMKEFMMLICAGGEIPYSRVFGSGGSRGISEQGSNAGGGGQDLKGYYDFISSKQKTVYTPAMDPLDQVLLRSALGRFDPNVFYEWSPLYQPDPKEVAAIALQKAQATQIYVNMALINEDALRSAVVNQLIEDGEYPGLEDAIDEFGEEPDEPEGDFDPQSGAPIPGSPTANAMKQIAPPSGGTNEAQDAAAPQRRGYLLGKKSFRQFRQAQIKDSYFAHLTDYWSQAARDAAAEARAAAAKHDEQAHDMAAKAFPLPGNKDRQHFRLAQNLHANAAAAYRDAAEAYRKNDRAGASEQMENARRNEAAAEQYRAKHNLNDASILGMDPEDDEGTARKRRIPGKPTSKRVDRTKINPNYYSKTYAKGMTVGDLKPRTLYVRRDVLNADAIVAWAKKAGFKTTLPADDMHVTVAFSKSPVDWMKAGDDNWGGDDKGTLKVKPGGVRVLEKFGVDAGCIVLAFSCSELTWRHEQIKKDSGASWDHPDYNPHITITYDVGDLDWQKVEPYRGPILLGPEIFEEINDDWKSGLVEDADNDPELTIEELATNAIYSIAASIDKNDFAAEVMRAETMIYVLIERLAKDRGVTQGSIHQMLSALPAVKADKVVAEAVARWRPPSNVLAT